MELYRTINPESFIHLQSVSHFAFNFLLGKDWLTSLASVEDLTRVKVLITENIIKELNGVSSFVLVTKRHHRSERQLK
jgi:hypothetical protein